MVFIWKIILTIFLLSIITIDANRARRRRRQTVQNAAQQPANLNSQPNTFNSQTDARQLQIPLNSQNLYPQGSQQINQGGVPLQKDINLGQNQAGRQYYQNQGQYGYNQQAPNYYPYNSPAAGTQYSAGQYAQTGQGVGPYGSYYNQYPGSSSFYSGVNSGSYYNRPGYSSNYYPQSGYNTNYGGNFWNAGQKQNINILTIFLSSLFTLVICWITI